VWVREGKLLDIQFGREFEFSSLPFIAKCLISVVLPLSAVVIVVIMWTSPQIPQQKNSLSQPPATIEQHTEGDNSPAIQGVEGDLNLNIDQNKSQKGTKEK